MANITTCSKCGRSYEATSSEEANRPDRTCLACFFSLDGYQIENVYPPEGMTKGAFLEYTDPHRRRRLCIGCVDYNYTERGWNVSIDAPYDKETDSDAMHIGTYPTREIALGVLWAVRHRAHKEF